jgi:hypothetical protein
MKRSLIICAAIFFIAALLGWRESRQLSSRREINARLVKEATAKLGSDTQSPNVMEQRKEFLAMRERVKTIGLDYFALFRDYGENATGESGEEFTKRQAEIKSRLEELDPAAIRQFMDECYGNPELNLRIKRDLNGYVRTVFIAKYPVEMARMMSKSPELFGIDGKSASEGYIQDPFQHLVYYFSWEKKDIQTVFQCLAEAPPEFQSKYIRGALEDVTAKSKKQRFSLEFMY